MKNYEKITALDFEMFNTKYYWSICWAGVVKSNISLTATSVYDVVINPGVREKFIGNTIQLPFSSEELMKYPKFDKVAERILEPLRGALVVGHAIENDIRMIADVCEKFSLTPPDFDFIDTNICYNAKMGEKNDQHSLSKFCEEFCVEFSAHDPSEDARATLEVMRIITDGDLGGFIARFGITVGEFRVGLIRRSSYSGMDAKQKEHVENFNKVFDIASSVKNAGKRYFFSNYLASEQDLSDVITALIARGDGVAVDSYTADVTVTNDLAIKKSVDVISFYDLVNELKIQKEYDFSPRKIIGHGGLRISFNEYLANLYAKKFSDGVLSGEKIVFSKAIEKRREYYEIYENVVSHGGQVCSRVDDSCVFVADSVSEIGYPTFDGRIIAFLKSGADANSSSVMTLKELLEKIK